MITRRIGERLSEWLPRLKDYCLQCWAKEYGNIFPQWQNSSVAAEELRRYGNPAHTCKLGVEK